MGEWIRINDSLPNEDEEIIGYNGECVSACFYNSDDGFYVLGDDGVSCPVFISHWMRFPLAPKD